MSQPLFRLAVVTKVEKKLLKKNMENNQIKGLVKLEGKTFWIDLTGEEWIFLEINPDGTTTPAHSGYFMDVLMYGMKISDKLPENVKTTELTDIYLGAVQKEGNIFDVRVYLVNISDEDRNVCIMQGSFDGSGDVLIDLGHSSYKEIKIPGKGFIEIDRMSDMGELDFTTYYNIKIGDIEYLEEINGWSFSEEKLVDIPILNQRGYLGGFGKVRKV